MRILSLFTFFVLINFSGCSVGPSNQSAASGKILGSITNIDSYDNVSISATALASLSYNTNARLDIGNAISGGIGPDGDFQVDVPFGCYVLEIVKPGFRNRGLDQVCVDDSAPNKDLGTIGLSEERRFVMTAVVGSKIIMAGGQNLDGILGTVDIYDTETGLLEVEALSKPRGRGVGIAIGSKAFFAGGEEYASGTSAVMSNTVEIYDGATGAWAIAALSEPRLDLAAAKTSDGYLVFAGGFGSSAISDAVDIYNSNTDTWTTTALPVGRAGMAAIGVGSKVYFAGGNTDMGGTTKVTRVDIYEPSTDTWTLENLTVARRYFPAVAVGGKILFAGGQKDCFPCEESDVVDIYDVSGDSWTTTNLSQSRELLVGISDGSVAVFAGGSIVGGQLDSVDIYDSITDTWSTSALSQKRTNSSSAYIDGKGYVIGGDCDSEPDCRFSNVIDIFDFSTKAFTNTTF